MPSSKRSTVDCEKKNCSAMSGAKSTLLFNIMKNVICLIFQNTIAVVKEQWLLYKRGALCKKNKAEI